MIKNNLYKSLIGTVVFFLLIFTCHRISADDNLIKSLTLKLKYEILKSRYSQ